MKKAYFLLLIGFITLTVNSQSYDNASEALELCSFVQGSIGNNFINDKEADIALDKILSVIGASKRFILQPCSEINNAVATSYKGMRYILYDKSFMNAIANQSNSWSQLFILAHEVGHHINGHSIDILLAAADVVEPRTLSSKRQQELESDEFAGFILGKLGATLGQLYEAIDLMSSEGDDTYSTHPNKAKRLNAIKIGYDKALGKETLVFKVDKASEFFYSGLDWIDIGNYKNAISDFTEAIKLKPDSYDSYNNRAIAKSKLKDHYGAITDYTIAIELKPYYSEYYNNRGGTKYELKDFYGALADFNKAIGLDPDNSMAYSNRGLAKFKLEDYYGAISDFNKAIELSPDLTLAYSNRALVKYKTEDYHDAITDYTRAIKLKPDFHENYLRRGLAKSRLEEYYGAITDYTRAIELKPDFHEAFALRGDAKHDLKDYNSAITDYTKAIELKPDKTNSRIYFFNRAIAKDDLGDYYGAINDFTKAIELRPDLTDAYLYRGEAKKELGDSYGACQDARKAQQLGSVRKKLIRRICK